MKQKSFVLQNKGMNRDLSISKAGESSAYENRNIRIIARDHDTLLSVTNERGNKEVSLTGSIVGELLGWNVLNNHIILFTHEESGSSDESQVQSGPDRIYRIDYVNDDFRIVRGDYPDGDYQPDTPLFTGNLGFSLDHPIESIVYSETEKINKIYWVDGLNVLRFMNFTEEGGDSTDGGRLTFVMPWDGDNTYFDSNRGADFGISAVISKDNTGSTRANGVVQYLLTYFNKHGQETGHIWVSDLIYLSPFGCGGAADSTNNNKVTLAITGLDTSFDYFRVYSVFRSLKDGNTISFLVSEQKTTDNKVFVVDDGAHLTLQNTTRLLYLGSKPVIASTLTHKDQTLFLGDLKSTGRSGVDRLEALIHRWMFKDGASFRDGTTYLMNDNISSFCYSDDSIAEAQNITYVDNIGYYPYSNQLSSTSSQILTFKGNEKYRFALKFQLKDGTETDAFWIGDKVNTLYPVIDVTNNVIKRVVFRIKLPSQIVNFLKTSDLGFKTVQLMIAEATYADRSVKAQGFVNPTMFNTWERYSKRTYSIPSWISRPRGSSYSSFHFESIRNSNSSAGEIQCNYMSSGSATPYFQYNNWQGQNISYTEEFDGLPECDYLMLVNSISRYTEILHHSYWVRVIAIKVADLSEDGLAVMRAQTFEAMDFLNPWTGAWIMVDDVNDIHYQWYKKPVIDDATGNLLYNMYGKWFYAASGSDPFDNNTAISNAYTSYVENMSKQGLADCMVSFDQFESMCDRAGWALYSSINTFYNQFYSIATQYTSQVDALNAGGSSASRWQKVSEVNPVARTGNMTPAYYKKHLMFIDENLITLDSPEIAYNVINLDKSIYRFRIVGVAKMHSVISDYTVEASRGYLAGNNLEIESFSTTSEAGSVLNGILSWPLWKETSINRIDGANNETIESNVISGNYVRGAGVIRYWLYMWHHSGSIPEFSSDDDTTDYSILTRKVFANLRCSYNTIYSTNQTSYSPNDIRFINDLSSNQYTVAIGAGNNKLIKYYSGCPRLTLSMPGSLKYPIYYQANNPGSSIEVIGADGAYFESAMPVRIEFSTSSHALISLPSYKNTNHYYIQEILPRCFATEAISFSSRTNSKSGALIPWLDENDVTGYSSSYRYLDYEVYQKIFTINPYDNSSDTLSSSDQYLYIGEIYEDYSISGTVDNRYGGISLSAVKANRFVTAGPQYLINDMSEGEDSDYIYANQGDTYFQRWDALRVKPFSNDSENNVIDITSVMLETHINLDGRTDLQRAIPELASIDTTTFGSLNTVYSQQNNFSVARDLDEDFNTDAYRSSLTWTLPKSDMADVDEWTHITLASSLKLDSDKGICRALRRMQNSIIAFQDRGISEVLFNSKTQLSTTDGVPVEIGNSGKVDGKRYITNKYGCINKWSIVEGKSALYFVDNINKAFCAFNGNSVDNLSTRLGFGVWFRNRNNTEPWNPSDENNFLTFFDRIHSDVYIVGKQDGDSEDAPALIYNELLGQFTSFFDYGSVPMIANVEDRLISYKGNHLWRQNEGAYCNFFGSQYDFWVRYRVTPEPYSDKIWTNVEYRADFYRVLDGEAAITDFTEEGIMEDNDFYQPNETFDFMRFWNEYQTTVHEENYNLTPVKKFRTWRLAIPRAVVTATNQYGLDRIRNPWMNLLFKKKYTGTDDETNQDLMQLHDIIVTYYE